MDTPPEQVWKQQAVVFWDLALPWRSPWLPGPWWLDLSSHHIHEQGAEALAQGLWQGILAHSAGEDHQYGLWGLRATGNPGTVAQAEALCLATMDKAKRGRGGHPVRDKHLADMMRNFA